MSAKAGRDILLFRAQACFVTSPQMPSRAVPSLRKPRKIANLSCQSLAKLKACF